MTFQSGQSGSPNGRPKGIIDKRSELRGLLEPHAKEIVEKLIETAKAGDPSALRLRIARLIPRVKPDIGISFALPEGRIDSEDNMLEIANRATEAVACGLLTVDEAEKFTEFLRHQRWLVEEAERKQQGEIDQEEHQSAVG